MGKSSREEELALRSVQAVPTAPEPEAIEVVRPASAATRAERRSGAERRGMEALRAEALQNLISKVEDRHFGGLREKAAYRPRSGPRMAQIMLVLVAIVAGGLAAFLATTQRPAAVVQPAVEEVVRVVPPPTTRILVATEAIGMGQRLSPGSVAWQDWPAGLVTADYINIESSPEAIAEMSGSLARFEFFPGEPIREQKLVQADQGYLSAVLDTGMRGVSVSVSPESASGGFIVPNDHVDVVVTRDTDAGQVSDTILRNVQVLAINARLGEMGTTGAPADPADPRTEVFSDRAIATLALDSRQAEIIINATEAGRLSLVLRSMVDFAAVETVDDAVDANQTIRMTSPFWTE